MHTSEPDRSQEATRPVELISHPGRSRVPLWLKLLDTAFMAVLVPIYLHDYGPTNFLYFCDVALFMALIAVWTESPLWASMPAVGILLPQLLWFVDFVGGLFGRFVTGVSSYMFSPTIPLFTRFLSFFHCWLPFLVLYLVWKLGYDRRAFVAWTSLALVLILVCYFLMPVPPAPPGNPNLPVNINNVYGVNDAGPQHWMHPLSYLFLLTCFYVLVIFLPTHLLLSKLFAKKALA
jgi:hypothetical protein